MLSSKSTLTSEIYSAYAKKRKFKSRKTLSYHSGCVNAIQFSPDGHMLASGGDDLEVLIWNVDSMGETWKPVKGFKGHLSNIFSIQFDSKAKNLLSY